MQQPDKKDNVDNQSLQDRANTEKEIDPGNEHHHNGNGGNPDNSTQSPGVDKEQAPISKKE